MKPMVALLWIVAVVREVKCVHYYWFNIVSDLQVQGHRLAVDIEEGEEANCEGAKLVLCPWDKDKPSQMWRWDGSSLKNRQNGLVWERDSGRGLIELSAPSNSLKQKFHRFYGDRHIYPDVRLLEMVVEALCVGDPKPCTYLSIASTRFWTNCTSDNRSFTFVEYWFPYPHNADPYPFY